MSETFVSETIEISGFAAPDVHTMFGLTYANYLVLNRTLLQSMPDRWQRQFCGLIHELDLSFDHIPKAARFAVSPRDENGRFCKDPVPHYERGRAYIEPKRAVA